MKDLLEAGVHFGHQTKRWNPKMKEFIFGERNGIYIIDLGKTVKLFRAAEDFVTNLAAEGRTVLFVGTKRQAKDVIAEEAQRCAMFYVNERWLGGLLTNFATIQRSLGRLRDLEAMTTDGRYDTLSKKEIARNEKERKKLLKNLEGIRGMARLPGRRVHRRHQEGTDRRRRGAQAQDSGDRRRRHQLRSRRSGLRHPRQRRRAAIHPAVCLAHRRRRDVGPRDEGIGRSRRRPRHRRRRDRRRPASRRGRRPGVPVKRPRRRPEPGPASLSSDGLTLSSPLSRRL